MMDLHILSSNENRLHMHTETLLDLKSIKLRKRSQHSKKITIMISYIKFKKKQN